MASPLGHVIVGTGVAAAMAGAVGADSSPTVWVGAAMAACMPDLDLLPTLWGARYWRVHRQWSHSILVQAFLAGLLWAASGALALGMDWRYLAVWGAALASHSVLDLFCTGPALASRGLGIPLLWPVTARRWHVRRPIVPDQDLLETPSPAMIARACLWELLQLCPASGALILLANIL